MAYDEETTARLRIALADRGLKLEERRMMGGVCFMHSGNMAGGAHREKTGEQMFMFRVGPQAHEWALSQPHTRPVQFGDRMPMMGFVFVHAGSCDDANVNQWLDKALEFVTSLPPKG